MAKIRNSLGLIVLDATIDSFPDYATDISFAEYKAKTGIDLGDLFDLSTSAGPACLKTVTKLLAIKCEGYKNYRFVSMAHADTEIVDSVPIIKIASSLDGGTGTVSTVYLVIDPANKLVKLQDL